MTPGSFLAMAGTLLPLAGIALTLIAALRTRGTRRWWVLALAPAMVLAVCAVIAEDVFAGGNRVAATLYILYTLTLALYYPLLAIAWLIRARTDPD